ncbi:hypothetical protein ABFS82_11G033200 [Erythranthe guttata]|uniref:glucose-6-phosphate 1-epimerase n=1 Tax=Erythranthe guttata TaxID=4155 RepID=A0A022R301_ERYGU|nr:PREDICTED: putative glucose-6-phosphate 1-epimerase [Erythranthe guttata]EYU34344.1 hypothetical protein MIMGU_mgv1a021915mg [Erythranthe guttata]|eukprot:XP_012841059.1 PREDICTED: putative glucose-6-phosphate 1-epimerase [Erythranthe guttata]
MSEESLETVSPFTAPPPPVQQRPTCKAAVRADRGGPYIILRQPNGYSAEILIYGAQVISWKNERQQELLFLSKKAVYRPPHPIRGGIPICFPKFFGKENMDKHGFARIRLWQTETLADDAVFPLPTPDNAYVDFVLNHMPRDFPDWPNHRFELRLRVILGPTGDLTMTSRVKNVNTNGEPFTFKFAYHTYFSVSNIRATQIEGLQTLDYLDYLEDHEQLTDEADAITFEDELDRVYLNTPDDIFVTDRELRRTITIHKDASLPEIVVWNPWDIEARDMDDLGDEEYREFVCVEAAAMESEITLNPNEEWTGTQRLSVEEYIDLI